MFLCRCAEASALAVARAPRENSASCVSCHLLGEVSGIQKTLQVRDREILPLVDDGRDWVFFIAPWHWQQFAFKFRKTAITGAVLTSMRDPPGRHTG